MSAPQPATAFSNASRGRHRYRRPRRGGHQEGPHPKPAPSDPNVPPPTAVLTATTGLPTQLVPPVTTGNQETVVPQASSDAAQSSRRGRGGRRGGAPQTISRRPFGGQLTQGLPQQIESSSTTYLQADAPEFKPGQPVPVRNDVQAKVPRARRMSKSAAPDFATRIHEDIANKLYECAICTSEVLRNSKIWSCKTCWTVFHLSCITKWSKNEGSTQAQQRRPDGEIPPHRQWRCPGCNLPKDDLPGPYTCWCAKELDPKPVHGLRPHSCGQTCGKLRGSRKSPDQKCPHPCEEQCHAGPCPPCSRSGPVQPCYCGRDQVAKRCVDTDYGGGSWTCGRICGDMMPCGEHECSQLCHEGLCGSCEIPIDSRCYCGKVERAISCCDRGDEKESQLPRVHELKNNVTSMAKPNSSDGDPEGSSIGELHTWIGSFACENSCERLFDCGKHSCLRDCHEQSSKPAHCPLSADTVTHCPCGKTSLSEMHWERISCEDPVPHCEKTCGKTLSCGHTCPQECHVGSCKPCLARPSIKCRCGRTTSSTICHQGVEEPPQCMRTCKALLNCGRHECAERCCPAEKTASDRQISKRKMRSMTALRALENEFEAEHICTRTCERPLKCGNKDHTCQELCHKGACGSCREAIFDEVACNCGRTVLQPPLPCGTNPPTCHYPCPRPKSCGHPMVTHPCHEDEACPKCPYLVQKTCMCGKSNLKNQPCWSTQGSCGQSCGRRLKCGIHLCEKSCHRDGECEDAGSRSCPHTCGKGKTACEHFCLAPCHAPYACKEDKPCQSKVIITCDCGRIKQETRCLTSKTNDQTSMRKHLDCDDECLRLARNRKLAQALNVDPDHLDSDYVPYATATLEMFQNDIKWSQVQEREFRVFAADDTEKRLRFKPMKQHQRAFLHALAEDFGFDSESLDPEPHRHIVLFKTPRFVSAPMKTLSQCAKRRAAVVEPNPTPKFVESAKPYNALILAGPRFALTLDELRTRLHADFEAIPTHSFTISFLPSEEVVIHETAMPFDIKAIDANTLSKLQSLVSKTVISHEIASGVSLCRADQSLNILRRENDVTRPDGWSQVVKGATVKTRPAGNGVGAKSTFTVLGTKTAVGAKLEPSKISKEDETVVDNWESAVDAWE